MKEIRRIMVFGAHPDDPDICCGGLALKLTRAGHLVKFVSMTNGDRGHYAISGPELAARRLAEAKAARAISGIAEYQVMDHHDCELEVNVANRCEVIRLIRRFAPDMEIIAPWREWDIKSRGEEIDYAEAHGVPLKISRQTNYSKDKNMWHLSHEGLDLEDPINEPQYDKDGFLELTVPPSKAPDEPEYVTIKFN